jgi:uncharacterized protein involved in response to NO
MAPCYAVRNTLFSYAFRPFFLLAGLYAVAMLAVWGLYLAGLWPSAAAVPVGVRHGHEMLFGFVGAAIAGFLLTAVATWTGRPPVSGPALIALCGIWIMARLAAFIPDGIGLLLWATSSVLFWGGLLLLFGREVLAANNTRNYKSLAMLMAFVLAEALFFVHMPNDEEGMRMALRAGLFLVLGMIFLVGGRIIPNFTQNWLKANRPEIANLPPSFDHWDLSAVLASGLFAIGYIFWPWHWAAGLAALAAAGLQGWRVLRWRGWLVWSEPLMWVLHLGYAWIPLGFALLGLGILLQRGDWQDAGLHALTNGTIGTLILGVAARVALGHTGRPLRASPLMAAAFWLLSLGTLLRVAGPFSGLPLQWPAALWIAAYSLFVWQYAPILLARRQS